MKTLHILITFALVFSLCLAACKDDDPPIPPREPDYRDTLAGTFTYTAYFEHFMMNVGTTYDTTYAGTLIVTVVDSTTNQVRFSIGANMEEYTILNRDGSFSRTVPQYRSGFSGNFYANDSLHIETGWSTNAAYYNARYFCKRQ